MIKMKERNSMCCLLVPTIYGIKVIMFLVYLSMLEGLFEIYYGYYLSNFYHGLWWTNEERGFSSNVFLMVTIVYLIPNVGACYLFWIHYKEDNKETRIDLGNAILLMMLRGCIEFAWMPFYWFYLGKVQNITGLSFIGYYLYDYRVIMWTSICLIFINIVITCYFKLMLEKHAIYFGY